MATVNYRLFIVVHAYCFGGRIDRIEGKGPNGHLKYIEILKVYCTVTPSAARVSFFKTMKALYSLSQTSLY